MTTNTLTIYEPRGTVNLFVGMDRLVCLLGSVGVAHDTIAEYTGLHRGQVSYRLKLAGIRVSDYRKGRGPAFKTMLRYAKASLPPVVERHIVKSLKAAQVEAAREAA